MAIFVFQFDVDINCIGRVKFESYVIEGASALWCAAGAGHFSVVKFLVKSGANVNHTTKSNSTPLRAACFDGRAEIVKFLVEEGKADFDIANKFNNTSLMIAAFNGHLNVVRYLLEAGVNPNVAANCGATALHFAAEIGTFDIVKELVEHGNADTTKQNNYGLTPLMAAAEHCQEPIVQYFFQICQNLTVKEQIDALELLGASFANEKEHYDIDKCYEYLIKAMNLRYQEANEPVLKQDLKVIKAYDNHQECETMQELQMRQHNAHRLHMEGLTIRERILGCEHPELPHPIVYRGAVFADATDFDKCVSLWLHALLIKQKNSVKTPVTKDVLRFAQVFSQMILLGVGINFNDFLGILEATAFEIADNVKRLEDTNDPNEIDDKASIMADLDTNMLTFLYLMVIFGKIGGEEMNILLAMKIIHKVAVEIKPKSHITGRTLIHLAVDSQTLIDEFHINDVVQFPCSKTAKLLIEAGIDVQTRDFQGNTPLHLIVGYRRVVGDFLTLHAIITALVDAGAHVDVVNNQGQTPMGKASTEVAGIILRGKQKLSLKCLSAQAVKRHGLSFIGQVPASLEHFISLHGP